MPNYRLTLEYDGRGFEGWQVQRRGQRTVQGELEAALHRVTGDAVRVVGAGRTDAGVHAEAQVANVVLAREHDAARLARALNGVLGADVAVAACARVPDAFHARFDARRKLYRYRVWNGASPSPLRAARAHWVPSALDVDAMRRAAGLLRGPHDFSAFRAAGSEAKSRVRDLERIELLGDARDDLALELEAPGFLRHMVRIVAGTLIEVGLGRRAADTLSDVLASRDRTRAGRTAPAHALTLVRIEY